MSIQSEAEELQLWYKRQCRQVCNVSHMCDHHLCPHSREEEISTVPTWWLSKIPHLLLGHAERCLYLRSWPINLKDEDLYTHTWILLDLSLSIVLWPTKRKRQDVIRWLMLFHFTYWSLFLYDGPYHTPQSYHDALKLPSASHHINSITSFISGCKCT